MEFLTRVLSGNSGFREKARQAEQVNQNFKANLDNLKRVLKSEKSEDFYALLDLIYESSFPEEQVFMKAPSRVRLKSKKELLVRLLDGLDSMGVPVMAEMLVFIRKYGPQLEVADSLMTLLELLSSLLEGKEAPDYSTDDVMDAMDFEWHSTSRVGSPLLTAIASATSSPRASAASTGDSPLHAIISASRSPYRRATSDRSMLVSRDHELDAKLVLDKTSKPSTAPPKRSLKMSASSQYPSAHHNTIPETPASSETIQETSDEKPSSTYSLDTLPASSQHALQMKHRRKSSSLQQLFGEDANDESSREGSARSSTRRNSNSSSRRQNSSEIKKIITNMNETSSPVNHGLAVADSMEVASVAQDKEFLSSIHSQDSHLNRSSQKGSAHGLSPSPFRDEVALWREDSGGFSTVDLISSNKLSASQSSATEGHADGVEASSIPDDLIKSSKSNILEQEMDILPACDSSLLFINDFAESPSTMSHTDVAFLEAEQCSYKSNSTEEPPEIEGIMSHTTQIRIDGSGKDANEHYEDVKLEAPDSAPSSGIQQKHSEGDAEVYSVADNERSRYDGSEKVEDDNAPLISDNDNVGHESSGVEDANNCSSSDNDHMSVEHVHGSGARSHGHTYSSSDSDELDRSSSQICKSTTASQGHTADCYNQLCKDVFEAGAVDNLKQYGHHSDLTPVKSLFKADSLKLEKLDSQRDGNESDSHAERNDKLSRRFAMEVRSLTESLTESLRSRGGSADREEEEEEKASKRSISTPGHVYSLDAPEEDAGPALTHVEYSSDQADVHSSSHNSDDDVGHGNTHEEVAVHGYIHEEDAVHAHAHVEDARQAHSFTTDYQDIAGVTHRGDHAQQDGCETASDKITLDDSCSEHSFHRTMNDLNLDASNMRSTAWADCADRNSTLEAPPFLDSSLTLREVCFEEISQSMNDQSWMQQALHKVSNLVEGVYSSLIENTKVEMPDPTVEDQKIKDDVRALDVNDNNASEPCAVAGHLQVMSDDEFEKSLSELDAAGEGVFCESGEVPFISCDTEEDQMGMLYQHKQYGLESPAMVEETVQEEDATQALLDKIVHPSQPPPILSDSGSAAECTKSGPAGTQFTDTESTVPFTGSWMQCGQRDANESRALNTDREPYTGLFTVDNAADDDMHAGFRASLEDDEHRQAHVHGHPTSSSSLSHVESHQRTDGHDLKQPATFTWDIDTNVPRSKRKGGGVGKLARGCLSCYMKPHTDS